MLGSKARQRNNIVDDIGAHDDSASHQSPSPRPGEPKFKAWMSENYRRLIKSVRQDAMRVVDVARGSRPAHGFERDRRGVA